MLRSGKLDVLAATVVSSDKHQLCSVALTLQVYKTIAVITENYGY